MLYVYVNICKEMQFTEKIQFAEFQVLNLEFGHCPPQMDLFFPKYI